MLTNEARAAANVPPVAWNDGLGSAAVAHSEDLAAHGGNCDLHNSCNGETWWKRVQRFYPGWIGLGENVAVSVSDPVMLHQGWMDSPDHRANILNKSFTEFGAGVALGQTNFGKLAFATEDFGSRGIPSASAYPALPGGSIMPLTGGTEARDLKVSYYHSGGGAPQAVRALVGTSCVNLSLKSGKAAYGIYGTSRSFTGSGCVPVVFEAIRSDGTRHRWPKDEAILVGVGSGGALCAERTTAVPTQDCGGGGNPTPTPTPGATPTPTPNGTQLKALKVVLKPSKQNSSTAFVQIQATLPKLTAFDPSANSVSIRLRFGESGDWSETVPQLCGGSPCLKPNKKSTVYRAKLSPTTTLSFTRGKGSTWIVRFSSREETLGELDPGMVQLTLSADGKTFAGSATGELKQSGLVAD